MVTVLSIRINYFSCFCGSRSLEGEPLLRSKVVRKMPKTMTNRGKICYFLVYSKHLFLTTALTMLKVEGEVAGLLRPGSSFSSIKSSEVNSTLSSLLNFLVGDGL